MAEFSRPTTTADLDYIDNVRECWRRVKQMSTSIQQTLAKKELYYWQLLSNDVVKFELDLEKFTLDYQTIGPMQSDLPPHVASDRVFSFQVSVDLISSLYFLGGGIHKA